MKKIKNLLFPVLLVLTCCIVHCWQHGLMGLILPYLPNKEVIPLAVLSPLLLLLTFFTTFTLLKQNGSKRPVLGSFISAFIMLIIVLLAALHFLNYAAHRYAGVLPVPMLPELPGGFVTMGITALCVVHLTVLFIEYLVYKNKKIGSAILSVTGWTILNTLLFLITT